MFAFTYLVLATILQLTAAIVATRLGRREGTFRPWMAFAGALYLMAIGSLIVLFRLQKNWVQPYDLDEAIALGIAVLLVAGILGVQPVFSRERRSVAESWERHRQLLDASPAVIYVKGVQGWAYQFVNRRFEELFDVSRDEIAARTDHEIFPRELADAFRENDLRVLESGEVLEITEQAPHGDELHTYISVKFPLRDGDGNITAVAGISTDITDLVSARAEAAELNDRLELILDSVSDGIYGLDANGHTTFVNRAAESMLGWSRRELFGRLQHAVIHHTHGNGQPYDSEDCHIYRAIRDGETVRIENEIFWRKDGSYFPVAYSSSPIVDNGERIGAVVTFRDRSEELTRSHYEHELRTAQNVQMDLYPETPPVIPGYDLAGEARPASQACGDYFDFIRVGELDYVLAIGDVSGHGLPAALFMVEGRALLRSELGHDRDLRNVVRRVNDLLEPDTPTEMFLTLFLARLDPARNVLTTLGAGHNAWIVRGDETIVLPGATSLLALTREIRIGAPTETQLHPGDVVVLVTDGVYEAQLHGDELFGTARMLETVRTHRERAAAEIVAAVFEAVDDFVQTSEQADDRTIIVLKVD